MTLEPVMKDYYPSISVDFSPCLDIKNRLWAFFRGSEMVLIDRLSSDVERMVEGLAPPEGR